MQRTGDLLTATLYIEYSDPIARERKWAPLDALKSVPINLPLLIKVTIQLFLVPLSLQVEVLLISTTSSLIVDTFHYHVHFDFYSESHIG